jgi:hypothetical protein
LVIRRFPAGVARLLHGDRIGAIGLDEQTKLLGRRGGGLGDGVGEASQDTIASSRQAGEVGFRRLERAAAESNADRLQR